MTDHSAPELHDLIDELTGDSTPEQQERIRQWSAGDPIKAAWVDGLREAVQMASDDDARKSAVNIDAVRAGVFAAIAGGERSDGESFRREKISRPQLASTQNRRAFKPMRYIAGLAAALLAAIVLPRVWDSSSDSSETHVANEYTTAKAQWINIVLPDGSKAVLGPETKLRYTSRVSGERIIDLQGQSYFTVTHNPAKPFTVRTSTSVTRVLGTEFSIRSYPEDQDVIVGVAEGRVSIGVERPTVILAAGDVGRITPGSEPIVLSDVSTAAIFGWMNGKFVYEDIPLEQIAVDLERYYGVTVEITDDQAKQRPVTTAFQRGSVSSVIKAIAMASDLTVSQTGNKIVFSSMSFQPDSSVDSSLNPSNVK